MNRLLLVFILCPALFAQAKHGSGLATSGTNFTAKCSIMDRIEQQPGMTEQEGQDASTCAGYMLGVIDGMQVARAISNKSPLGCYPEEIGMIQAGKVVLKYIREHPEKEHLGTLLLVMDAFQQAFPCPAK